jgi:hypothetical protein
MRRLLSTGTLSTVLVLVAAAAAPAATTVSATVTGGSTLSIAGVGTPSFGVTLNGTDQLATYTLAASVVDARGLSSGGGWNLTITSTVFSDGAGHTFPATASTLTGVTTSCGANSTCTQPANGITNSQLAVPAAAVPPTAVKYLNAANATGLGTIAVNGTISVAVPSSAFAGTYTSTVTVSIIAGP